MKLGLNQIKEIATGAVLVKEENSVVSLKRFTAEQEELYRATNADFYNKTFSTSGIKFLFKTDSKNLYLDVKVSPSSSRKYFSVDVFVNGSPVGFLDNFADIDISGDYTKNEYPLGDFSKSFVLGDGVKTVCIHLPWSVNTQIKELSIDDNSFIEAVKPKKKLLAYGDSITHGYDALRPSNRYISKLASKLDAEEFNKGIGGEMFFPELAKLKESFVPDYITVAYGTNDWNRIDNESFKCKCKEFYINLTQNYPESKIFAITPIWRKDYNEYRAFGPFENVEKYIKESVELNKNITVISGYDLVPKSERYFGDLRLHPNDDGFDCYVQNLYEKIKAMV